MIKGLFIIGIINIAVGQRALISSLSNPITTSITVLPVDPVIPDIFNSSGILAFQTEKIYQKTLTDLKAKLSAYQPVLPPIGVSIDIGSLTQANQELELVANLEKPFRDFETSYRFSSLRLFLFNQHNEFMKTNTQENPVSPPNDHYIIDHAEQTVLNQFVEVIIGGVFFRITPTGCQTYKTRVDLEDSRSSVGSAARRLEFFYCTTNRQKWTYRMCKLNPNIKIETQLHHYPSGGFFQVHVYTQCHWRWFEFWFPYPAYYSASAYGNVSGPTLSECSFLSEVVGILILSMSISSALTSRHQAEPIIQFAFHQSLLLVG